MVVKKLAEEVNSQSTKEGGSLVVKVINPNQAARSADAVQSSACWKNGVKLFERATKHTLTVFLKIMD